MNERCRYIQGALRRGLEVAAARRVRRDVEGLRRGACALGGRARLAARSFLGHTRGHSAVAVRTAEGWLLHCGDAYFSRRRDDRGGARRLWVSSISSGRSPIDDRMRRAQPTTAARARAGHEGRTRVLCALESGAAIVCDEESFIVLVRLVCGAPSMSCGCFQHAPGPPTAGSNRGITLTVARWARANAAIPSTTRAMAAIASRRSTWATPPDKARSRSPSSSTTRRAWSWAHVHAFDRCGTCSGTRGIKRLR